MKKIMLLVSLFCLAAPLAQAAVQGKEVSYQANGTTLKGYLAYDAAVKGRRPAVLVVHEWWGTTLMRASVPRCWQDWATPRWRWICTVAANRPVIRTRRASSPPR